MLDFFYTPSEKIKDDQVIVDEDEFNHLVHVMRKKVGERIMVVDGLGNAYEVLIKNIIKKSAECKIIQSFKNYNESNLYLTLAVGILKNPSKFDFLVEKAVEMGVKRIIPLSTERTIPQSAKIHRWQKLSLAAMKQSRRSYLPEISELISFNNLLRQSEKYQHKIIFHNTYSKDLSLNYFDIASGILRDNIIMLIGPEGGFTEEEVKMAMDYNFMTVNLGKRRLRTETAAIAACSILLKD